MKRNPRETTAYIARLATRIRHRLLTCRLRHLGRTQTFHLFVTGLDRKGPPPSPSVQPDYKRNSKRTGENQINRIVPPGLFSSSIYKSRSTVPLGNQHLASR